jgi:hypothetical protein
MSDVLNCMREHSQTHKYKESKAISQASFFLEIMKIGANKQ